MKSVEKNILRFDLRLLKMKLCLFQMIHIRKRKVPGNNIILNNIFISHNYHHTVYYVINKTCIKMVAYYCVKMLDIIIRNHIIDTHPVC